MGQNPVVNIKICGTWVGVHVPQNGGIGYDPWPNGDHCFVFGFPLNKNPKRVLFVSPGSPNRGHKKTRFDLVAGTPPSAAASCCSIWSCLRGLSSAFGFREQGGSFCHLWWKLLDPLVGFLFKGVAHFLAKGGKKTPLIVK